MDNLVEFPGARSVIGQRLLTDTYVASRRKKGPWAYLVIKKSGGGGGGCEVLIHLDSS